MGAAVVPGIAELVRRDCHRTESHGRTRQQRCAIAVRARQVAQAQAVAEQQQTDALERLLGGSTNGQVGAHNAQSGLEIGLCGWQ